MITNPAEERNEFENLDQSRLVGLIQTPPDMEGFVVLLHSITESKDEWMGFYADFTEYFRSQGYGILRFDFRGHGESAGWDDAVEPVPVLQSNAFVGWDTTVIGGVSIGENSYIAAGATDTRDVPPNRIVVGANNIITPDQWTGQLAESGYFTNE